MFQHGRSSWTLTDYVAICGLLGEEPLVDSGMTTEHLRPLLDEGRSLELFSEVCSRLAQAKVARTVVDMVRSGRLTALTKPDGGVRGIVAGDVIRRLVARTMAQQMAETVERATAPHQYALSSRAGCECVAHVLQGLTEFDPETTVTSLDGIGVFDTISREAMLRGLRQADDTSLSFVSMFYGLLFALGQHEALQAVSRQLRPNGIPGRCI